MFGRSANTKKNTDSADKNTAGNIFLNTKNGIRVFRVPHGQEEIRVKRHWLALNDDGSYEPKFGYSEGDKRRAVPVIVAVWNPDEDRWVGDSKNWRNNPIDRWVAGLDEADREKKYAQDVFFLNVLDLTKIIVGEDGTECYPDENMKYAAKGTPKVNGVIKILTGSSGEPDGKSLYAHLLRTAKSALDDDGEVISIYGYELRLVTSGKGKDTNRGFNMGAVRPMPKEYENLPVYDLAAMCKPWPNDAIQALMDGADYNEVVKQYGIVLYPPLITVEKENEEELFND